MGPRVAVPVLLGGQAQHSLAMSGASDRAPAPWRPVGPRLTVVVHPGFSHLQGGLAPGPASRPAAGAGSTGAQGRAREGTQR